MLLWYRVKREAAYFAHTDSYYVIDTAAVACSKHQDTACSG